MPELCDVVGCHELLVVETKSGRKLCASHALSRERYAQLCDVVGCHELLIVETKSGRKLCTSHALSRERYAQDKGGWEDGRYIHFIKEWEALTEKKK